MFYKEETALEISAPVGSCGTIIRRTLKNGKMV